MNKIEFKNMTKSYGKTKVVNPLNMTINEGERLVILGPSGCGKSTTLRIIAGLEDVTDGELHMSGRCVNDVKSGDRNVAMVFQNYALFPHMSVKDNIIYALKVKKLPKEEIEERFQEAVQMLKLQGLEDRKPKELSGGQRQRVALARAVVKRGDYFLLDEPLSNLDAQLRGHARKELVKIHEIYKQTFVYVTHDQVEAMTVGERIALMYQGDLQMLDTPKNVYNRPRNIFTAKFIGSPATNVFDIMYNDGVVSINNQSVRLPKNWTEHVDNIEYHGLSMGIRAEHIVLTKEESANTFQGKVKYIEDYGNKVAVYFDLEGEEIIATLDETDLSPGDKVFLELNYDKIHMFDKGSELSIGYPEGVNVVC